MANVSYCDPIVVGDRLVAQYTDSYSGFGKTVSGFDVVSLTHARCKQTGKLRKLNRRGYDARLFVGNAKVLGRI